MNVALRQPMHNSHVVVGDLLRGGPCCLTGSDLKVRVASGIRYPDAFVVCTPVDRDATVLAEPAVAPEAAPAEV